MTYQIENEFDYRLHHIRPRFKDDVEGVLFYVADSICLIGRCDESAFKEKLNNAIKHYPGNRQEKTINNWRTEISALFGLIKKEKGFCEPSELARKLHESGDLVGFFRNFLFTFQYPGGHLKPREVVSMIDRGVKFHPARFILSLLQAGTKKNGGERFGISREELTHLVFNDLRVTRGKQGISETLEKIIYHRNEKTSFDYKKDTTRYAGDILDYMVLGDFLYRNPDGRYYPKMQYIEEIKIFSESESFFGGYDDFYLKGASTKEIEETQEEWFLYVNSFVAKSNFETDLGLFFDEEKDDGEASADGESIDIVDDIKNFFHQISKSASTKQIGDFGEAIAIQHETKRISSLGKEDLVDKIKKIPDNLAVGYDIKSYLGINNDFSHIQIEVKSTISKNPLQIKRFTLTPNEFDAAKSYKSSYFVYRILISSEGVSLFVIRNPIQKFKDDCLDVSLLSSTPGAHVSYGDEDSVGEWVEVLL